MQAESIMRLGSTGMEERLALQNDQVFGLAENSFEGKASIGVIQS